MKGNRRRGRIVRPVLQRFSRGLDDRASHRASSFFIDADSGSRVELDERLAQLANLTNAALCAERHLEADHAPVCGRP